jgi:predicted MFS family arabinose efflux permease
MNARVGAVRPAQQVLTAGAVAFVGLLALAIAMGVGRFAFTPVFPLMQRELGIDVRAGAWLATSNYVGYFAASLAAVWLRLPAMPAIGFSLAAVAVSTAAMAWTDTFGWWVALRFVAGVASALVLVFVSGWALEHLARCNQLRLRGIVFAGVGVGIAGSGIACWLIASAGHGAALAWVVLGVASLLAGAAVYAIMARAPAEHSSARLQAVATGGEFWRLVLCYGAFGFAYIVPATFLPVMAKAAFGASPGFSLAWPVFGAAAAVSTLLAASVWSTLPPRRLWRAAKVVMAAGLIAGIVVPGIAGILAAAIGVGGTFMVMTMAGMQEARRIAGTRAQSYMAAMTAAFAAGQILGPVAIGLLPDAIHPFQASMISAAVLLLVAAHVLGRGEKA